MASMASTTDVSLKKEELLDYRVRKVVFKMLAKRGYAIPPEDINLTKEDFAKKFVDSRLTQEELNENSTKETLGREKMTITVKNINDDVMYVFFPDEPKVGVPTIKECYKRMEDEYPEQEGIRCIIVCKDNVTPFARTSIDAVSQKIVTEVFRRIELLVDITEHELVPEHQVLSDAAKQNLLKRYKLSEAQLPRLQKDDPVARYFGLQKQQVVKIIRPSETAGRYVTYRIVW